MTEEKIPVSLKVPVSDLEKFFEVGESVRILQGIHAGEPGMITSMSLEGTHANVLMEHTKSELKIILSNLRRKEELDPNCKHSLSQFLLQGKRPQAKSIQEIYNAGDLILFDNHQSLGLVL